MPKGTKQQKTLHSEIQEVIERHLKAAANKDELKEVVDTFIAEYNKLAAYFAKEMAETKAKQAVETERIGTEVSALEERLRALVSNTEAKGGSSLEATKQELLDVVKSVQDLIPPEADLSELYDRLTEHETIMGEMSMLQKAENIRNALELLEGDERLKAEAISGLKDLFKSLLKEVDGRIGKAVGAIKVPSPVGWTRHQGFSCDGGTTVFSLDQAPGHGGKAAIVRYEGQVLTETTHYSIDGTDITTTFTPNNGTQIDVTYWPY